MQTFPNEYAVLYAVLYMILWDGTAPDLSPGPVPGTSCHDGYPESPPCDDKHKP
jgi:hypothetical protein